MLAFCSKINWSFPKRTQSNAVEKDGNKMAAILTKTGSGEWIVPTCDLK